MKMKKGKKIEEYKESEYFKANIKKYDFQEVMSLVHWIDKSGGVETIIKFWELTKEQQDRIKRFLEEAYIAYNQVINGENKLYVHSRPFRNMDIIRKMKGKDGGVRLKDLDREDVRFCLWNREEDTFTPCLKEGFFTICGHTKTYQTTILDRQKGFICLDEGCGATGIGSNNPNATVGLYCMEDNKVLHIDGNGRISKTAGIRFINEKGESFRVNGTELPQDSEGR